MRIIINAVGAKKNSGGGFQIALNFVKKALADFDNSSSLYFLISQDIADNLGLQKTDRVFVFPNQPDFLGTYRQTQKKISTIEASIKPDVVYSIVAPSYFFFKSKEIMRYTNPWVAHPNKYAISRLTIKEKIRNVIYCQIQKYLMRKCKYFITQTSYTASCIARIANVDISNVRVIENVLPASYQGKCTNKILDDRYLNIISVSAAFPHKNLDIIPDVCEILEHKYGMENVRFHVTLPEDSSIWKNIKDKLSKHKSKNSIINHGRMSQEELSNLYRKMDIMFLPSLLEVFSASILEAMYFEIPIIASRFPFNTNVIKDGGLYFTPCNGEDAAKQINLIVTNNNIKAKILNEANDIIKGYINYDEYYEKTIEFLNEVASK